MKSIPLPSISIAIAALAVIGAAGWFLLSDSPAPVARSAPEAATPAVRRGDAGDVRASGSTVLRPPAARDEIDPAPANVETGHAEEPVSIAALERKFHATTDTAGRLALVAEIAGRYDAAAVGAIGRLFSTEGHPNVKLELLSALGDIDDSEAPEVRLQTLTAALHRQPRDVRISALDLLNRLEDPRATALLRKTMADDPDKEVRATAEALYRERLGEEAP